MHSSMIYLYLEEKSHTYLKRVGVSIWYFRKLFGTLDPYFKRDGAGQRYLNRSFCTAISLNDQDRID